MRRSLSLAIVLSLVTTAVSYGATAGDPPSWDLLDNDFGGATSLTSSGWTAMYGYTFDETVSADSSTLRAGSDSPKVDRAVTASPGFDPAGGDWTYEIRMRHGLGDRVQTNANFGAQGWELRTGSNNEPGAGAPGHVLVGSADGIEGRASTPVYEAGIFTLGTHEMGDVFPGVDMTAMNTFRVVVEGTQATLYMSADGYDDTARFAWEIGANSGVGNVRLYMDSAEPVPAFDDIEIDYVRAAAGAWTPDASAIPEPATMALLGLGGMMLIRRRRHA